MDLYFLLSGDMGYLLLIVVTLVIGLGATAHVNSQLRKYTKVPSAAGMTGAQIAEAMLRSKGITNVPVVMGRPDQNHFDPRTNSITLDPNAYNGRSITSIATACHEAGHACQFAEGYAPMKVRGTIVPAANIASNAWMFLLLIGIFMNIMQLVWLAVIMYAAVVVFQIVTLPVEFNASSRALAYITQQGAPAGELDGSRKVLRACALTYVAAALTSVLQLLWLLGHTRDE